MPSTPAPSPVPHDPQRMPPHATASRSPGQEAAERGGWMARARALLAPPWQTRDIRLLISARAFMSAALQGLNTLLFFLLFDRLLPPEERTKGQPAPTSAETTAETTAAGEAGT